MKCHEKNDMIFLLAIFSSENLVEMSVIYLGEKTNLNFLIFKFQ